MRPYFRLNGFHLPAPNASSPESRGSWAGRFRLSHEAVRIIPRRLPYFIRFQGRFYASLGLTHATGATLGEFVGFKAKLALGKKSRPGTEPERLWNWSVFE